MPVQDARLVGQQRERRLTGRRRRLEGAEALEFGRVRSELAGADDGLRAAGAHGALVARRHHLRVHCHLELRDPLVQPLVHLCDRLALRISHRRCKTCYRNLFSLISHLLASMRIEG